MISKVKKYLIDKLTKIIILLTVPGSLKAERAGIYFEFYKMLYTLKKIEINPKTILDVGANRGMFSKAAHYIYPDAKIIAFEPLKNCFNELKTLVDFIEGFECYNFALGKKTEKTFINRSSYDFSSSLLRMSERHKKSYPYSASAVQEEIQVNRLDEVLTKSDLKEMVLLKIDVQGYEKAVMIGTENIIDNIDVIICEVSFVTLYEMQPLFDDMYKYIVNLGFIFKGYVGESEDPQNGQILQIDALFIRESKI